MADVLIFRIDIKKEFGGFVAASNFIAKFENGDNLCAEEVRGITTYLHKGDVNKNINRNIIEIIDANMESFRAIRKPENLYKQMLNRDYVYAFCVDEKELRDLVEWQYYYLIKKYYSSRTIVAFLLGTNKFYFKTSHYLYDVNCQDKEIYDSVFYKLESWRRLQLNNIPKLKDFVPIQQINQENIKSWQKKLKTQINKKALVDCMLGEQPALEDGVSAAFQGCLDLLGQRARFFKKLNVSDIADKLLEGNILAFILFAFSFYDCLKSQKALAIEEIMSFYSQIQECAICCQQLIENVVFHSAAHTGVLSIRFHSRKTQYLTERYSACVNDTPHLEVLITDYAGVNMSGNLAQNFIGRIERDDLKVHFDCLQPIDFFDVPHKDDKRRVAVENAFKEYYSISENIGRHFGLKIFKHIIEKNQGIFSFYSHESHQIMAGEMWGMEEDTAQNRYAQCLPGTAYSFLFPLSEKAQNSSRAAVGIDENIEIRKNAKKYVEDYHCSDKVLYSLDREILSQADKEEFIGDLAKQLTQDMCAKREERLIIYISADEFMAEIAEYICKALLIAGYREKVPDYVFYNCSEHFVEAFRQSMNSFFCLGTNSITFHNKEFAIALFTKKPVEELIIIPGDMEGTILANRKCGFASGRFDYEEWDDKELFKMEKSSNEMEELPPYDILYEVCIDGEKRTIFEYYTLQVLDKNIQERDLGCKITDTHMRLGSTIHINCFYEAELLFSNRLFVSRFAYLLAKDIKANGDFVRADGITLYSYALYSELLIYETQSILQGFYPNKSLDYAILEREADHRDFSHVDRIRYSSYFKYEKDRIEHYKKRKVICIVPINSTLKTHEKLIDSFCKENAGFETENIIMNFAIVLVGSEGDNNYWSIDKSKHTFSRINLKINPIPRYFVTVKTDYQEALGCDFCFPDNPLAEIPLIEVNAASTIPDQAFGLYNEELQDNVLDYDRISSEEKALSILKDSLVYSHTSRGENHYSFYFKTDQLFLENSAAIEDWMVKLSDLVNVNLHEYHILVCPAHFSNAGFLECINKIIFHDAALIMRMDIDKEYRCNMETKYSFVQGFLRLLNSANDGKKNIRVYYIDDSIVSGRKFHRARSLVSSVLGEYTREYENVETFIFDKVFVLLDRNSSQTRMQYIENTKKGTIKVQDLKDNFFAFRSLNISSMRNHGDSCVICQLERQCEILLEASSTMFMADHWKREAERFTNRHLTDKGECESQSREIEDEYRKLRAFRRMFCMHMATSVLNEKCHGNKKGLAIKNILVLLLVDYNGRKAQTGQKEAFEYFISYIKVLSRPFLSFSKVIREAIFDILLIFSEMLLAQTSSKNLFDSIQKIKPQVYENRSTFKKVETDILREIIDKRQKKDLLLVLMKQSMELRSNYYIRENNIKRLVNFIDQNQFEKETKDEIYNRYLWFVKNLIGVSSDTSKSAWLNEMLYNAAVCGDMLGLPENVYELLILENTRGYLDGIKRLAGKIEMEEKQIKDEINKLQYRDFRKILESYNWTNKEGLKEIAIRPLLASVKLLKVAESFKQDNSNGTEPRKIMNQCKEVVTLMKDAMCADRVQLILYLPLECDLWEDELRIDYNKVQNPQNDPNLQDKSLSLKHKNEYIVIANSEEKELAGRLSAELAVYLEKFIKSKKQKDVDYVVDLHEKYWLWEIGRGKERSITFFAEFSEMTFIDSLQKIRNVMAMRYRLSEDMFGQKTINHLYELAIAEKEQLIYNINKFESHTTADVRNKQYTDVQWGDPEIQTYYKSYVLTLLSDLQVSDIYRSSLNKSFYFKEVAIGALPLRGDFINVYEKSSFYFAGITLYPHTKLVVHTDKTVLEDEVPLQSDDLLIGRKKMNGESVPLLLIFALITNAAVERRAKLESIEGNKVEVINVYLTKTKDGNLRIRNLSGETDKSAEQIYHELEYPPGRDQGISLWSMSRYIKSIIGTIAKRSIFMLKSEIDNMKDSEKTIMLAQQREMIETLLSEEYQIKINQKVVASDKWFYIDIPILADKYRQYEQYFDSMSNK